jgi:hypothetical protein
MHLASVSLGSPSNGTVADDQVALRDEALLRGAGDSGAEISSKGAALSPRGLACANPDKEMIELAATATVTTTARGYPSFIDPLHELHI